LSGLNIPVGLSDEEEYSRVTAAVQPGCAGLETWVTGRRQAPPTVAGPTAGVQCGPCLPRWMSCLSNLFSASWLLLTAFCIFPPECTIYLSAHLTCSLPSRDDLTCGRSCQATLSAPGHFEDVCLHFALVADLLVLLLCSERRAQVLCKNGSSHFRTPAAALLQGSCVCSKKIFTNTGKCL